MPIPTIKRTIHGSIELRMLALADIDDTTEQHMLGKLVVEEKSRAAAFRHRADRCRFAAGRYLARVLIGERFPHLDGDIQFVRSEQGKPFVPGLPLHMSISHGGNWIVLAASPVHSLGVDVEKIEPRCPNEIVGNVLHSEEQNRLDNLPEAERAGFFYRLWTRKEAVLKAMGHGLTVDPSRFTALDDLVRCPPDGQTCHVMTLDMDIDYQLSIAWPVHI